MIPVTKPTDDYQVVHRNGSGFHSTVEMTVTHITELSYVGDLYDAKGNCIARDRRFFFADAIHPALTKGEMGMVKGQRPDDFWTIPEIKKYLDSVGIDYEGVTKKTDLLALLEEVV